jgi:hypothetical protein
MPAAVIRRNAPPLIASIGICRGYGGGLARDERAVVGRGPACGQDLAGGPAEGMRRGSWGAWAASAIPAATSSGIIIWRARAPPWVRRWA